MGNAQTNDKASCGTSAFNEGLCRTAFKLYRPPFRFEHGYILDAGNNMVADDQGQDVALRVRGWGRISYLPTPEALQSAVGELMANALTEYWTRRNRDSMLPHGVVAPGELCGAVSDVEHGKS